MINRINIIGVPIMYGCDREGPNIAPDTLREFGLIDTLKSIGKEVYDLGNVYIPKVSEDEKFLSDPKMKYFDQVYEIMNNLAERVSNSLSAKAFPLIIGGDHSLGLGVVSGLSSQLDNLAVIWIDAHGDINTHLTSPSGNMHGMPLAALMGEGDERLVNLYNKGVKIKPENVFLVGCRSIDEGEHQLIAEKGLKVYNMDTIHHNGIDGVIEELLLNFKEKHIENIHISLDIDSLDPKYAPGTGTKESGGMEVGDLQKLLTTIVNTQKLRSMSLVELNPLLDDEDMKTTHLCIEILKETFSD